MKPSEFVRGIQKHWHPAQLIHNIVFLLDNDLSDVLYDIKDQAVEDVIYEFDEARELLPRLTVLTASETISLLAKEPKSYARFGDGEIAIMEGRDGVFQTYDPRLAEIMRKALNNRHDNLYIGLNRSYFQTPFAYEERNHKFYRRYGTALRRFFVRECDPQGTYLDASAFGAYFRYDSSFDFDTHYERIKRLFLEKDLILLAGEGHIERLRYDLFEYAASKRIIHGPSRNAFASYDELMTAVKDAYTPGALVCLMMGMTATAMAIELSACNIMAWDIGHIAKEYDAFMRKVEKTQENMDAFWRD